MEIKAQQTYLMIGSVPMSLTEVTMAPAIIGALIKNRGHCFEFWDINLKLYQICGCDTQVYYDKIEKMSSWHYDFSSDEIVKKWLDTTLDHIQKQDFLIVNVFSTESQIVAWNICKRLKNSRIKIFMGGVGSHKLINNVSSKGKVDWINKYFSNNSSYIFGQLMLDNNLINHWQQDVSTSLLEIHVPDLKTDTQDIEFDFSVYELDSYNWIHEQSLPLLGSYGCVRQCAFCDVVVHFGKYKFVESDKLTKSIVNAYQTTKVSKYNFMDSLVNGSLSNFESLLKNLAYSKSQGWLPQDFSWSGTYICRQPNILIDRIHELLPLSGAKTMVIGVESPSDKIRFEMDKKFTNQDLIYELEAFDKYNVCAELLMFTGWPTETVDDFYEIVPLFKSLAKFGQRKVIDNISLSTHGFNLIDGTPIDRNKEEIGLVPGPTPFLWFCATNPNLDLYEIIRRRILAVEVARHYGLPVMGESNSRRQQIAKFTNHKDTILKTIGKLKQDILDYTDFMQNLDDEHSVSFKFINAGTDPMNIWFNSQTDREMITCFPGTSEFTWQIKKPYLSECVFYIEFVFPEEYSPNIAQFDNGEYYSKNGVYIDKVMLDYNDITLWGFNQLTTEVIEDKKILPTNYYDNVNKRMIINNCVMQWHIPKNKGIHHHLWSVTNVELDNEINFLNKKFKKLLDSFC